MLGLKETVNASSASAWHVEAQSEGWLRWLGVTVLDWICPITGGKSTSRRVSR